jgi:hypothetical protein
MEKITSENSRKSHINQWLEFTHDLRESPPFLAIAVLD